MISQIHRFHGHNSLRKIYGLGQAVRGASLSLKYLKTQRTSWRAAVVISRKVHKSAVVRNRIRRRIYEIIRNNSKSITSSYDMVLTVYDSGLVEMPHDKLEELVTQQLRTAGIISSNSSNSRQS